MNYWLYILAIACLYAGLAVALNLVAGYTGILSVCHAAFFGIGAYTSALLVLKAGWAWTWTLPAGVAVCAVPALLVGILALRLKNDYLIVATFAVQIIANRVMQHWFRVTQGELGVSGIPAIRLGGWTLDGPLETLCLALSVLCILLALTWRLVYSPFGRLQRCVREDEMFVASAGKSVGSVKLVTFVLGASIAAVVGAVYASTIGHIDPGSFDVMESVFILSIVIIGGAGSFWGPVLGAFLLVGFQAALRFAGMPIAVAANVRQIVYGSLLVFLMIWRPAGVLGRFQPGGDK